MTSELPKYRRVYAALRHDILIGKYDADEKFLSEGMLMRRFGVSRITVRQAMSDLKKDGFLEARSGSGTYLSALARHATGMIGLVIQGKRKFPTIHQPIGLLAETAIATLLERIRRPNTPPRQILANADKIAGVDH